MENKTPMQEAIDKIKEISNNENITGFSKRAYSVCLDVLEPLLEKEKELLIDFHCEGQNIEESCGVSDAQDYYNEKFNKNGK
ncbi:hypothetical protein [Flavobacterium sp.]|jgi:hypothetical protein|uniref:hypothetical protein n=1 Tax=Flavobacterium sp. TaxID=239 RepID=UPI0037BFBAC7